MFKFAALASFGDGVVPSAMCVLKRLTLAMRRNLFRHGFTKDKLNVLNVFEQHVSNTTVCQFVSFVPFATFPFQRGFKMILAAGDNADVQARTLAGGLQQVPKAG